MATLLAVLSLVMVFWNARGISSKEPVLKGFLAAQGAAYAGISETQVYQGRDMSDERWRWDPCVEKQPAPGATHASGGLGAFIDRGKCKASLVHTGKYTAWHRVELNAAKPLFVGSALYPHCRDMAGHREANAEMLDYVASLGPGSLVVYGGDLNCHTGANGDGTAVDSAGKMFLDTTRKVGLHVLNFLPAVCADRHSRVEAKTTGVERSTIDYVCCSSAVLPLVKSLRFHGDSMGSDHKPLVLRLGGMATAAGETSRLREVWRLDRIPSVGPGEAYKKGDWSWVRACQQQFRKWAQDTPALVAALESLGADSDALADVYDWSFQAALEGVATEHIGKKLVGPRAVPRLTQAVKMLVDQRRVSEAVLAQVTTDPSASDEARTMARTVFLKARGAAAHALKQGKRLAELELYTSIEKNQCDSKLFWGRVKRLRGSRAGNKSPPPVVADPEGGTESDPQKVVEVWRAFCAGLASRNPPLEEGIYDDRYREDTMAELDRLRSIRLHQDELDRPITDDEVFAAIRALRPATAPGPDGMLVDILRSAADAVNNNSIRGDNTVVKAVALMFNFVLDRECWPRRWGGGDIIPLYKGKDSRLDPGNYRPITLLSVVGKIFGSVVNKRLVAFTEATGLTADEQGGFRPFRGTPDQVLLMREGIGARKELGLQTLALFIDVRKAYDTVWRERAYVDLHNAGVNGKLWRQLQAMQATLTRRVRTSVGVTDDFGVERGTAQGAVESPWFYSAFLNPLAERLRARGLGIMIGGRYVPLLMYADDIVLLAGSPAEMSAMCDVCTEFASERRFQVNGPKCGLLQFYATARQRAEAANTDWQVFGEKVGIVDTYEYLGSVTTSRIGDWSPHVRALISKAKHRSADLLWMCRAGDGMRPRTAIVLFNSLVRPILEYCAVLWEGCVSAGLSREVELVQTEFLRAVSGVHRQGMGVSNDFIRAEHGVECLSARRAKLKAGFWRRLHTVDPQRVLRAALDLRTAQVRAGGGVLGSRSVFRSFRESLRGSNLAEYWDDPDSTVAAYSKQEWKQYSYAIIDGVQDRARAQRMAAGSKMVLYNQVKYWGENDSAHAAYSGEVGRLGFRVPEPYLDDRTSPEGTVRLKMLARGGALPLMDRIGRERGWPRASCACLMCATGQVEDIAHVLEDCPAYADEREELRARIEHVAERQGMSASGAERFRELGRAERVLVVLGKRLGDAKVEAAVDLSVKMYLGKVWRKRGCVRVALNGLLHRSDS
jgi:hypothetical protein